MAKIVKPAHTVYRERKVRLFELREDRSCGFQFDVVEGELLFQVEAAKKNYYHCLEHPEEYEDKGIVTLRESFWQEAVAVCECGKEILLHDTYIGAGECEYCGRWHNLFGQEIRPPEEWKIE